MVFHTIIDLDPGPRANFARVIQVARWANEVIDGFGLNAAIKTSGSTGLHIYLPLPPRTPNDAATLVAQTIATKIAQSPGLRFRLHLGGTSSQTIWTCAHSTWGNAAERFEKIGDVWGEAMTKKNSLRVLV